MSKINKLIPKKLSMEKDELVKKHIGYIKMMVDKGGPEKQEYSEFSDFLYEIQMLKANGIFLEKELTEIRKAFKDTLSKETIQGFIYLKPHGYSGDFEIIDKIYLSDISDNPKYRNWDIYAHTLDATIAVRNRKKYFKNIFGEKINKTTSLSILNIASGPSRDIYEFYAENPNKSITIDCVELDKNAIEYSKNLLNGHKVNFINENIFRFATTKMYDVVWSAGLFDYFSDSVFIKILQRLISWTKLGGEIIVGNFSTNSKAQPYMEFIEWKLNYRTQEHLMELALKAGARKNQIQINQEPLGVNLFLHIKKV